jgi:hypothetical protein
MAEYILRDQAIIAVTGAKLPDVSASGLPIANGKRSVTDCIMRLKEIPAADVVTIEEHNRVTAENDALKKKVASLQKQISRLKSDASWDEDIRRGQVQGMW